MYNRELQIIDTQEKAYLLGLFYADGNIGENETQCRITLKEEDYNLIFHLKSIFPFFYIHKYEYRHTIELGNYNKKLKEDLILNGCLPRKSTCNRNMLHIPSISDTLIRHFIRGYYDGNGGCTVSNLESIKKTQKRVYIYSASYYLLKEIQEILNKNNIKTNNLPNVDTSDKIKVYKLTIRTASYKDFYNFIYNDCTVVLTRKITKLKFIIDNTNFFTKKVSPPCIFCHSHHTVCDGTYYKVNLQRYLCRNCNKIFTAPLNSNIQSGEGELLED